MECERYQDCSWFQEKPNTDFTNKLSPAELTLPDIETNDFDLAMQFANRDTPPWGDDNHIELFDDDVKRAWNDTVIGEKQKNINNPANDYYYTLNYKTGDNSVIDTYNHDNYVLRKTDSFDMKNISSTDPAEVVPISYREKLNNYGLYPFDEVKSEVKEEVELYSPGSNSYVVDSDDSDLLIGREETIEVEENTENIQDITEKLPVKIWQEEKESEKSINLEARNMEEQLPLMYNMTDIPKVVPVALPVIKNDFSENLVPIPIQVPTAIPKPNLSLELPKATFDQAVAVNTPDLDFMDLVDFINSDVASDPVIPSTTSSIQLCQPQPVVPEPSQAPKPAEKPKEMQMRNTYLAIPRQVTSNSPEDQKLPKMVIIKTPTTEKSPVNFSEMSTINFQDLADASVSIAERIKTSSKRRRSTKYSISELTTSDDEDRDDNDEDYDHYKEETSRRRFTNPRKRSRSTTSESSCASKKIKEEPVNSNNDRYRELRDKNNEASRRSRQNRKDKEKDMFKTLEDAERKNVQLKARAEELEKLVNSLRQLLLQVVLKKGGAA